MNVTLPKKAKFLLSDDIREETNGKMTIIGLYADDCIYLNPLPAGTPLPPGLVGGMSQLCISCMMLGGAGTIPTDTQITAPNGQVLASSSTAQDFRPGAVSTLAMKGSNVAVPTFGKYKCHVTPQGGKTFSYTFEILQGPAPALRPGGPPKRPSARRHK